MINTELYELAHGSTAEVLPYINKLEDYFKSRRENVVGITILSNFCVDNDMTNFIHKIYPETKDYKIYRGLLVELRANYKVSIGDMQFLYPQLCKQRGIVEIPTNTDKDTVIARIKDIKELNLNALKGRIENKQALMLSPLYNSLCVYETSDRDNEWGMVRKKYLVGYDLSCDKFLINFWKFCIEQQDLTISTLYSNFVTSKIEGSTVQNLINSQCQGILEYVLNQNESEMNYVSDISTNMILRNDQEYFVYNHCVNLLGLNNRPFTMQTSMLAGLKEYKAIVNNNNSYKYVFPYETGFKSDFHSWDNMNEEQKVRLETKFYWNKAAIPFNTYLMQKVHMHTNDKFRQVETILQVIPKGFYNVIFCRVSTHDVYEFLDAKHIVQLQPGDNTTEIYFPVSSKHIINSLLLDNYDKLHHFNIINEKYYDENRQMLKLPRKIAALVLSFE